MSDRFWPRFEVFSRDRSGKHHVHMGSLHAADAESARRGAHDRYTRLVDDRMAYEVAGSTPNPEVPLLTIADLGILREVRLTDAAVTVTITPANSDCLAVSALSADIGLRLRQAGFDRVSVLTQLVPAWSSDWITAEGQRKLAAARVVLLSGTPRRHRPGQALPTATGLRVAALVKPAEVTGG